MPRAAFTTLGCKVNQYETQHILESFEAAGFEIVPFNDIADVYVINSCSVTSQAESKSRQTVRSASRRNPNAKVIVTGCAAQMAMNKSETMESADLLVPNPEKLETLQSFLSAFPNYRGNAITKRKPISGALGRTRATVKIQDGCSVYCSYCSIPYTRPQMMSRPWKDILQEVELLGKRGYKEIVLTGVLIGSYGPETGSGGPDFEELIQILSDSQFVTQIRISSIEMRQVSSRLVEIMKDKNSKVVPHLHIPLQSGSTKVLQDMNRPYSQTDYITLCRSLYRSIPDLAISADIMVGFPTETEDDFLESIHVCNSVGYAKAHIFRFSPRYGTAADQWGDTVSPQTKLERSQRLQKTCAETQSAFINRFLNREMDVLVEGKQNAQGLMKGHTKNYIEVEFAGPSTLAGTICKVRINQTTSNSAIGELIAADNTPSKFQLKVIHS